MEIHPEQPTNSHEAFMFKGTYWELPTDLDLVEPAREALFEKLQKAGWNLEEVTEFVNLAFHEALVNCMTHGNLGIPGDTERIQEVAKALMEELKKPNGDPQGKLKRNIHVSMEISEDEIEITVWDEGDGFDVKKVPDPTSDERLLMTTGRGIKSLMEPFCDSVTYNAKGNEVTLKKTRQNKENKSS